ncbi:hypothetical protein CO614_04960 [Lysobacteraceae bacterium NML120232]|nr:hypothetical protein CO608_08160 [Xanthomonadaceae bacterium NML08-0793]PJK12368.1 hypothetical protein CO614_04960 [Xanthomonadaceae bacterium NML120232]
MHALEPAHIAHRLAQLKQEHRDLDDEITLLHASQRPDELTIKRLKKRKLQLKDWIAQLESALIPDEPA